MLIDEKLSNRKQYLKSLHFVYNTMKWVNTAEQIFRLSMCLLSYIKAAYSVAEQKYKFFEETEHDDDSPYYCVVKCLAIHFEKHSDLTLHVTRRKSL